MKYFIFLVTMFYWHIVKAQNFVTIDGEFMDTISETNPKCPTAFNYYYSVGGKYPKSSMTLLEEVKLSLSKVDNNYFGSGYITFRFIIDCEGKMLKKVQVIQTDEEYKKYHFDRSLVNNLYQFLRSLDKWKTVKFRTGEFLSYTSIMSFKIQNGKVVNIIP